MKWNEQTFYIHPLTNTNSSCAVTDHITTRANQKIKQWSQRGNLCFYIYLGVLPTCNFRQTIRPTHLFAVVPAVAVAAVVGWLLWLLWLVEVLLQFILTPLRLKNQKRQEPWKHHIFHYFFWWMEPHISPIHGLNLKKKRVPKHNVMPTHAMNKKSRTTSTGDRRTNPWCQHQDSDIFRWQETPTSTDSISHWQEGCYTQLGRYIDYQSSRASAQGRCRKLDTGWAGPGDGTSGITGYDGGMNLHQVWCVRYMGGDPMIPSWTHSILLAASSQKQRKVVSNAGFGDFEKNQIQTPAKEHLQKPMVTGHKWKPQRVQNTAMLDRLDSATPSAKCRLSTVA